MRNERTPRIDLSRLAAALLFLSAACRTAEVSSVPSEPPVEPPTDNRPTLSDLDALFAGVPTADELVDTSLPAILPAVFDVARFDTPVKDQGGRGVCSVFASVALVESLYKKRGLANPDFSEQFLQWSVKTELGAFPDGEGSHSGVNLEAVSKFGIVEEPVAPYQPDPWGPAQDPACDPAAAARPRVCFTNGDPPDEALAAPRFKLPMPRYLHPNAIKSHLAETESGATIGLPVFYQSWNHGLSGLPLNGDYWRAGFVTYPNDADRADSERNPAGHGVLIVGWDDTLEVPVRDGEGRIVLDADGHAVRERGFYLFKNSWGAASFGLDHPFGPGYGWISQRYVAEHASVVVADPPAPE